MPRRRPVRRRGQRFRVNWSGCWRRRGSSSGMSSNSSLLLDQKLPPRVEPCRDLMRGLLLCVCHASAFHSRIECDRQPHPSNERFRTEMRAPSTKCKGHISTDLTTSFARSRLRFTATAHQPLSVARPASCLQLRLLLPPLGRAGERPANDPGCRQHAANANTMTWSRPQRSDPEPRRRAGTLPQPR